VIAYAVRRLVLIPLTFFVTFLAAFTLTRAAPPNHVETSGAAERCDRSGSLGPQLLESFAHWCRLEVDACTGFDVHGDIVLGKLETALAPTLLLVAAGLLLAVVAGIAVGGLLATAPLRRQRAPGTLLAVLEAMPAFVLAPLLLWWLGLVWNLTPVALGDGRPSWPSVVALALPFAATHARMVRDELRSPASMAYRTAALARGHSPAMVRVSVLRLAALPVFAGLGGTFAAIMMGAVAIEVVFGLSGLGRTLVDAGHALDFNTLLGVALAYAIVLLMTSALFDVAYAAIDPRVRGQR
jgi:ABC-type dipeptide/oligopeptide/nickel transport system permease component